MYRVFSDKVGSLWVIVGEGVGEGEFPPGASPTVGVATVESSEGTGDGVLRMGVEGEGDSGDVSGWADGFARSHEGASRRTINWRAKMGRSGCIANSGF